MGLDLILCYDVYSASRRSAPRLVEIGFSEGVCSVGDVVVCVVFRTSGLEGLIRARSQDNLVVAG